MLTLMSRIGEAPPGYTLSKNEYRLGEQLGGFTFPFNAYGSTGELFRRFGLWLSSNGVCKNGVEHPIFRGGKYQVMTNNPVMVGDYLNGVQVLESQCLYLDRYEKWQNRVLFGEPTYHPLVPSQNFTMLDNTSELNDSIAQTLVALIHDLVVSGLTKLQDSQGLPLNTAFVMAQYAVSEQQALQKISASIHKFRGTVWH